VVPRPRTGLLVALAGVVVAGCGFVGAGSDDPTSTAAQLLTVTSSAFDDGAAIPRAFSCKGADRSPPLAWSGVPDDARSVALVVDDPDAPNGTFIHWVVYNIDPQQSSIEAGAVPEGAQQATNSAGRSSYSGPCPPSGTHHYRFTVYVLRSPLTVPGGGDADRILAAIASKATARGTLTGTFAAA
jgi:Raf kinase inhibitor-like YbhB/YbcL family protein